MAEKCVSEPEKLAFMTGSTQLEAEEVLRGERRLPLDRLRRSGLDTLGPQRLAANPRLLLRERLSLNALEADQLRHLPRLAAERVDAVLNGRPFFSFEELQAASGLSQPVLEEILKAPDYRRFDKTTGRMTKLSPAPGIYITPKREEFEANRQLPLHGYLVTPLDADTAGFTLFQTSIFEAATPEPHLLKRCCYGRVLPGLRDADGFTRLFVPLRLDIWFRPPISFERAREIVQAFGLVPLRPTGRLLSTIGFCPTRMPSWPPGDPLAAILDTAARLQAVEEVAFAEPDEFGLGDFQPDRLVARNASPGFESAGQFWNHEMIGLAQAHARTRGSPRVSIYVIDSGMRVDHPDLKDALRADWGDHDLNFSLDEPEAAVSPVATGIAHGTRVASVAVARGTESSPIDVSRGIAPGCPVLPIKISGSPMTSGYGYRAAAIRQALALVRPGERGVINISWGMSGDHIGIREALIAADRQDVAIVTSAGNYSSGQQQIPDRVHYPSAYCHLGPMLKSMCSVAACNARRERASYSYFGRMSVSFAAPGGELGEAGAGIFVASLQEDYAFAAGTSFAAPHVAGLIALLFSLSPGLRAADAIELIRVNCDAFEAASEPAWDQIGAGIINAGRTVEALYQALQAAPSPPAPMPPPIAVRPASTRPSSEAKVNINTASRDLLLAVPGLAAWYADSLLAYRQRSGPYPTLWHLVFTGTWDFGLIARLQAYLTV